MKTYYQEKTCYQIRIKLKKHLWIYVISVKNILSLLILIKIYLSIDQPTQQKRFDIRKNHLLKYWKLSTNDFQALSNWDTYTFFKNRMFALSAKKKSPWIVINANNKMTARLNALRYVLGAIDYEGKKNLKIKSWTLDQDRDKIKVLDVLFENLNKEQYQLLNNIKQTL